MVSTRMDITKVIFFGVGTALDVVMPSCAYNRSRSDKGGLPRTQ